MWITGKKHKIYSLILLGALLGFFGCSSLPEVLRERSEKVPLRIEKAKSDLDRYEKEYADFTNTDEYKSEFYIYAAPDRENWKDNFRLSSEEINRAEDVYNGNVVPILERNHPDDELKLRKHLKKIDDALKFGAKLAKKTGLRISELREAKKNSKPMQGKAAADTEELNNTVNELEIFVSNTQEQFPNKKADLDNRLIPFKKAENDARDALKTVNEELGSSSPDYGIFTDNCALIAVLLKKTTDRDAKLRSKVSELGRDYSKILRDMKIVEKPWVEEVKYTWNNYSDFDTTKVAYRRKKYVSMNDYNTVVNRLGPDGGIIGRGSDYEIWIENFDIEEHYYHKYLIVEDDKENTTDWVEVDEKMYEANEDNINMSIVSKPFGFYEDEVIKAATPPGFDKVGNPKYGRWVENKETGNREWSFFQRYLFWHMILNGVGPRHNYYTYGRWNDWNNNYRGRRAYYGTGGVDFGSSGRTTSSNPRVRNSTYAKSGGFKSSGSGIRAAGSSTRGRGPGSGK